jgi:nicotinate-nucleotide adenylyltransferase
LRRIGLFGGTFDPPHMGHLVVAEQVRDDLHLDEVRLVVANEPWQKRGLRTITSVDRRLAMSQAALGRAPGLSVSDVEVRIGGPSFTSKTLSRLASEEPDAEWLVIVGSDAAAGLESWHDSVSLRDAVFVVVDRPGSATAAARAAESVPPGFRSFDVAVPAIEISSTSIRQRIADGRSVRFQTPDQVIALVEGWGLYRPLA